MIQRLKIVNLALIHSLELELSSGLNVLSGETGAGKSIIVDSLSLLLGGRYDKTMLRYGEAYGYVEGVFDVQNVSDELTALGMDEEDILIVNRKFYADGKNEIRLNGRTITASMLKRITPKLIDLCGQNEHQSLGVVANHIKVLDYYIRHNAINIKQNIAENLEKLKESNKILQSIGNKEERLKTIDFLRFGIDEIKKANVKDGEEEELIALRKKYLSAETVKAGLQEGLSNLSDAEQNALDLLYDAKRALLRIEKYVESLPELTQRLSALSIELQDVADSLNSELEDLDFSDQELDRLEKRLEVVRNVSRKYGSGDKLKSNLDEMLARVEELENADETYEKTATLKKKILDSLYEDSKKLSQIRHDGALIFQKAVVGQLSHLGMTSEFEARFAPFPARDECEDRIGPDGMDKVEFYLSPNVGQPLNPLVKIISGGELSRLMLALKVVSSEIDETPTLIFDEIDTGISGKIGLEVAKQLAVLSGKHQLLCVTHLPQICAMADQNFYIYKSSDGKNTETFVSPLTQDSCLEEIARLSGSKDVSEQSLVAAKDMKNWSDSYKATLSN